jgi:glycosyltransferase involved in cell wall biosynthesis
MIAPMLEKALAALIARRPDARILLLGRGGVEFAAGVRARDPRFAGVFWTPGYLGPEALSYHLQASDVALQPYPDGADTRRTSLMACLANGVPTVITRGRFTTPDVLMSVVAYPAAGEPHLVGEIAAGVCEDEEAVLVGAFPDLPLRDATWAAYRRNFAVEHTVARLLADEGGG